MHISFKSLIIAFAVTIFVAVFRTFWRATKQSKDRDRD